eukprot:GGOE01019737.1.p5 GENE.GGOE01019737.1~~GGOE01019737.1.p5  ORF type:complete len:108 (-),score=1.25 GGOE01019737.1:409-732(-)
MPAGDLLQILGVQDLHGQVLKGCGTGGHTPQYRKGQTLEMALSAQTCVCVDVSVSVSANVIVSVSVSEGVRVLSVLLRESKGRGNATRKRKEQCKESRGGGHRLWVA